VCARGQQSTGTLDQIARPDEMVSAKVFVPFIEAPGNGEAGDDSAQEILGFVDTQNRHADPVQVFVPRFLVELLQRPLPVLPVKDVILADGFIGSEQGRDGLLTRFGPDSSETEREDELAVAGGEVNFSSQRDVSVFCAVVLPRHLEMLRKILPAVRCAGESNGTF